MQNQASKLVKIGIGAAVLFIASVVILAPAKKHSIYTSTISDLTVGTARAGDCPDEKCKIPRNPSLTLICEFAPFEECRDNNPSPGTPGVCVHALCE